MEENIVGTLIVESGPDKGKETKLVSGHKILIGRSLDSDICIPDKTVSRKHAELSIEEDSVFFVNYGVNGSLLDGIKIRDNQPRPLSQNTTIGIGPSLLRVTLFLPEKTEEMSRTAISSFVEQESQEAEKKFEEPSGKEKSVPKESETQILKSPVSKAVVIILILFGALYLFLPKGKSRKLQPKTSGQQARKRVANKDSLVLRVRFPEIVIQGRPSADEKKGAISYFKAAEKLFSEQKLREQNIYDSIEKWQKGINILGKYSQRPAEYDTAVQNIRLAKRILHRRFRQLEKTVRTALRQKDYPGAYNAVQTILASIPDIMDWRYRWAKKVEANIKPKLTSKYY